ncbi:cadherin-10-like [Babylonia areolata]|uniref:cadherin-10-like n=1 Tax=Babylonia areolata TaxID=304850 RepID=UPI003FD4C3DB
MLILACLSFLLVPHCCVGQNIHPPVFPAQTTIYTVSELTSIGDDVFSCTATDDDTSGPAATLQYSIVGGTGEVFFSVDNATCDVTLARPLDYESGSEYDLVIQAVDLDLVTPWSASVTFTIQVTDVNEYSPNFVNVTSLPVTVPEDSPTGSTVFTCTVTDEDSASAPSGQHSFFITSGNVDNKFNLDNETCDLTLVDSLDFERLSRYDVQITATDLDPVAPRSASMVISIQVDDVNEEPVSVFFCFCVSSKIDG